MDTALELSRPLIEESRHELLVSTPKEPLLLDVDPVRMAQVVSNLLNNAAKYTPEGGRIELSAERDGNEVVIRVRDNGVGLTSEACQRYLSYLARSGKPWIAHKEDWASGLALVKRLVEMHRRTCYGRKSRLGERQRVHCPSSSRRNAIQSEGRWSLREQRSRSLSIPRRILIVDDNVDGAETLATLLMLSGHTVELAHTGPDALKVAHAFQPRVMFLDIDLPGMSGYEVARQLRSDSSINGLTLVALTGWGSEEDRQRAQNAGFDHHLTKPVEIEKLHSLLVEIDANNK